MLGFVAARLSPTYGALAAHDWGMAFLMSECLQDFTACWVYPFAGMTMWGPRPQRERKDPIDQVPTNHESDHCTSSA